MPPTIQRILIVDDDEEIGRLFGTLLEDAGYSVSGTLSGKDGLRAILRGGFNLVILDLGIADLDGSEILRAIRKQESKPKVLAISGAVPNMLTAAKALGADLVFDKQESTNLLVSAVRELIEGPRKIR